MLLRNYICKTSLVPLATRWSSVRWPISWVIPSLVALAVIVPACSSSDTERQEILVFAAASLADALEEIGADFEAVSGNVVTFSFGGSQTLAQQVVSGAPVDLIIAAGEFPVQFLVERNLVLSEPVDLLTTKLVTVIPQGVDRLKSLQDLTGPDLSKIAIAAPALAPAGAYSREALINLGLWEQIEKKLVFGPDVRATLAYVESGNVDAALVYETDAQLSDEVDILDIVPIESYSPVIYPVALLHDAPNKRGATLFLEFLTGPHASKIFRSLGFQPAQ